MVEWAESFDTARYAQLVEDDGGLNALPEGCLGRIVGSEDSAAYVIEVWRSAEDARRFGEKSGRRIAGIQMPAPTRAVGFEATTFAVR
jgi:hypothetical protein